jgi:energy-coupling factor transporter ATP-binding protein EcfA2
MFRLLYLEENPRRGTAERPVFFQDLNLDQIMDQVTEDWGQEVRAYFYAFPESQAEEAYRRAIYSDVKKEEIYRALMEFTMGMRIRKQYLERRERVQEELQKQVWYLREAQSYIAALEKLKESLEKAGPASEGMKALLDWVSGEVQKKEFHAFRAEVLSLWQELSGFRVLLTYEKERFTIAEGKGTGKYDQFLSECFPAHEKIFKSPFLGSEDFSNLEEELVKLFRKKHKDFFERLNDFYQRKYVYLPEGVPELLTEMGYYLSFAKFQRKMQENDFRFCTPRVSGDVLSAKGLYDLALALTNLEKGQAVVSNDAYLAADESFFVLTGPNQGGKTTYARSLGQLIYFTKMGLDVPAEAAEVPYYQNLWTHFSVEESAETGRGKLMDELVRLKPMMQKGQTNCFIVINELFTTAANYDANVMGKRVLKYFIGEHWKGIYVTHLSELAKEGDGIVSLRAGVDANQVQTYEIRRSEAKELAGANRQVEKYRLTYEQLKERFA